MFLQCLQSMKAFILVYDLGFEGCLPSCPSLMSQRERAKERGEKAEKNAREGVRGVA